MKTIKNKHQNKRLVLLSNFLDDFAEENDYKMVYFFDFVDEYIKYVTKTRKQRKEYLLGVDELLAIVESCEEVWIDIKGNTPYINVSKRMF